MARKKGKAYQKELKRHRALEKLVKKHPNLPEEARREVLARMDLWRKGAIEGDADALIQLSIDFGLYDAPPEKNEYSK